MSTKTIKVWLDSGANHQSCYEAEFEIDSEEWDEMTEDQKDEYARDIAFNQSDWGWREV